MRLMKKFQKTFWNVRLLQKSAGHILQHDDGSKIVDIDGSMWLLDDADMTESSFDIGMD